MSRAWLFYGLAKPLPSKLSSRPPEALAPTIEQRRPQRQQANAPCAGRRLHNPYQDLTAIAALARAAAGDGAQGTAAAPSMNGSDIARTWNCAFHVAKHCAQLAKYLTASSAAGRAWDKALEKLARQP